MNNSIQKIIFFVTGLAIGSIVTKKILEDKYNKLIDEQVEKETASIKEIFDRDATKFEDMKKNLDQNQRENVSQLKEKINKYGYSSKTYEYSYRAGPSGVDDAEVISHADSLDEAFDNYERESLSYYSDGVLATTNGDEMITEQEADGTIGRNNFLNIRDLFAMYPDDSDTVYIRNDETQMIYEIFRDSRTYLEVTEE